MIIYKIKSRKTGEFSKGGSSPSFSKKGKVWTGSGPLALHFNNLDSIGRQRYKDLDCVVIAYELSETECFTSLVEEHIEMTHKRKAEREAAQRARIEAWRKEQERREYERLKKVFENGKDA